jgi:Family of unknown function (DUF5372)
VRGRCRGCRAGGHDRCGRTKHRLTTGIEDPLALGGDDVKRRESVPAVVRVTRPRHALHGLSLAVLGQMRRHGRVELLLMLPDGSKSLIPAGWTDRDSQGIVADDAATDGAPPVGLGSVQDLRNLLVLLSALSAAPASRRSE